MSIKSLRLKRGMTQQELADKISGFDYRRVSDYETGRLDVLNMTLGKALQICDALHVSNPRKLLDDDIE